MSQLNETLTDFLFPTYMRPYWTFRTATAVALLATVVSGLVRAFVTFPAKRIAESGNLVHSPVFLGLYYLSVAIVLWLIYATRHRATWYVWRVSLYGMVLTGSLIGLLNLLFPLHAS